MFHWCNPDTLAPNEAAKNEGVNNMPAISHTKAAEAHESAAKIHRTAAERHQKGDHKAGLEHSEKATKL